MKKPTDSTRIAKLIPIYFIAVAALLPLWSTFGQSPTFAVVASVLVVVPFIFLFIKAPRLLLNSLLLVAGMAAVLAAVALPLGYLGAYILAQMGDRVASPEQWLATIAITSITIGFAVSIIAGAKLSKKLGDPLRLPISEPAPKGPKKK